MIPIFAIWLAPVAIMAGIYAAPRLRGKTDSGDPKIFWGRFVMYALILSAVVALTLLAESLSRGWGLFPLGLGFMALEIALSLVFGFAAASLWLWDRSMANAKSSFLFKKLKAGPAWGVFWAVFFAVPYFALVSIHHARMDFSVFPVYPLLFALGAVGGTIWGAMRMREIKKWIVGDKAIIPSAYADQSFVVFLGGFLIYVMFVAAPMLFSRAVFGLTDDALGAALLGLFLGASVYRFIWVRLYEKRNGVQLVYEYTEADQPAEAAMG